MFFNTMKGRIIAPGILFLTLSLACSSSYANVQADTAEKMSSSTTDHSKFEILQNEFATGPDVTKSPALWVSGLLYLFYPYWGDIGIGSWSLGIMALIHTAAAFALIAFLIVHLYMSLTTSEKPFAYLKAMITGKEEE